MRGTAIAQPEPVSIEARLPLEGSIKGVVVRGRSYHYPEMTNSLSKSQARKIIIRSQCLDSRRRFSAGINGALEAIKHLGYVQIDTLSVVERAHLHSLWNRVSRFSSSDVDKLQEQGKIFEHWAHALAYLPMEDFRFSLPMMRRLAAGEVHWYPKNSTITKNVLDRIRAEGPLSAKDFSDKKTSDKMWSRSPSKIALEQLFMEGQLMIPKRINFHKVYDLTERVIPSHINTKLPSTEELANHLLTKFIAANGIAKIKEVSYLRKGLGNSVANAADDLVDAGKLSRITVNGAEYLCDKSALENIDKPLTSSLVRILSPFDNAVIQRKRLNELFDYDYQIECYVPKSKRRFGYFCLPILYNNGLVGRIDAKADRKSGILHLYQLHVERTLQSSDRFFSKLHSELYRFAQFNGCSKMQLHHVFGASKPDWN